MGILRNLTKNVFAVFCFDLAKILDVCAGILVAFLVPLLGWFGPTECRWASALVLLMIFLVYRYHLRLYDFRAWRFLTFPLSGCLLLYAVMRSTVVTLWRGGVVWRAPSTGWAS